jgi:hypothetical protein
MHRTKSPAGLWHKVEGPRGDEKTACGRWLRPFAWVARYPGWSEPVELEAFVPPSPRCKRCWPEQVGEGND